MKSFRASQPRVLTALFAFALATSVSIWLLPIYAPLWLDETVSFFIIKGRFSQILSRQGWPGVPAYPALLWLWVRATGRGEVTLRLFSILAMLGAAYLLYRTARELFDQDAAMVAAIVFCVHPVVIFAAVDIRPYSFAALAITAATYSLVRMRGSDSLRLAASFGLLCACVVYFQFLFVVILPAFALGLFTLPAPGRALYWRRVAVAFGTFAVAFLAVIPGMVYMFHTSGTHVFSDQPTWRDLVEPVIQMRSLYPLLAALVFAVILRKLDVRSRLPAWPAQVCVALALIPLLTLYGVSIATSIHIFVFRYRLVAAPGIALCWALLFTRVHSRCLRLMFCLALVAATSFIYYRSPVSRTHDYTWKYALDVIEKNAAPDHAPVLLCSDLPESDFVRMPSGTAANDSALFAPLSYYPLSVPVVALPRALNAEATRVGSQFLQRAQHQRFFAAAFMPSWETLDWLEDNSDETHSFREIGTYDGITVVEFTPR